MEAEPDEWEASGSLGSGMKGRGLVWVEPGAAEGLRRAGPKSGVRGGRSLEKPRMRPAGLRGGA